MNMKRRLIQYPVRAPAFAIAVRNSASASAGSTSSASRMKTQGLRKERFSSAQFFFFGQVPLNSNWTTRAPQYSALRCDASVLSESTTKISSAHPTEARQRARFWASFLIGTMTETGTGGALLSTARRDRISQCGCYSWRAVVRQRDEG